MNIFDDNYLKDPSEFEYNSNNIWTNDQLKEIVFNSYFTADIEGGSEDESKINSTVEFIVNNFPTQKYPRILDLGCGPGFYSYKLAQKNYLVTGIDISDVALSYAKKQSNNMENTNYFNMDIFNMELNQNYNIILLLFFTYSNFKKKDRKKILQNVKKLLVDKNSVFLFDVGTIYRYNQFNYFNYWEKSNSVNQSVKEFILLGSFRLYENHLLLHKQVLFFKDGEILEFLDWQKHFSISEIENELKENGFEIIDIFGDALGRKIDENSEQMYLLCKIT